ncbi:ADC synthase [Thelephora ganbajun]|uniref:ADC synthase n=1 Tax=Thelephora ganbajun TaxID=370292 RepID=A0ACB6ZWI7_THEGA|nr:ADC synthase [Thelephora ganbajun]
MIHHTGEDLFEGIGSIEAVRYHSLHVDISGCPELEELAWVDDGSENGRVVMGVRHSIKPFWAVQYHPESVRTVGGGKQIVQNFWSFAKIRNATRDAKPWGSTQSHAFGLPWPPFSMQDAPAIKSPIIIPRTVNTAVVHLSHLSAPEVCELLGAKDESSPFVVLDSAAKPGRFTIIGSLLKSSPQFIYHCRDSFVTVKTGNNTRKEQLGANNIWLWMKSFMRQKRGFTGSPDIPFWGGLVGILSYEIGVDKLKILGQRRWIGRRHPDLNMVFVERSVVVDSTTKNVYVQSLLSNDDVWVSETVNSLKEVSIHGAAEIAPTKLVPTITTPRESLYKSRISLAQEKLFAGESYELCLTALSHISLPRIQNASSSSWRLFRDLRKANPAPHSAYLRLHPTTLVSSSPERFLSFSRPSNPVYQLRPIKGTVRKGPGITRAVAEDALIGSPKEVAENLMIVDLITHDLHGVVGENVVVKKFCGVEEYETLWQLVSVIEGTLPRAAHSPAVEWGLGWDLLGNSLPPGESPVTFLLECALILECVLGSMTGAPKKRSVEILQTLEDSDRSIYSGTFGYWCVSGAGDWAITIRSCFKYDDGSGAADSGKEEWRVGAGGAITALSTVEGEWDEMHLKLQSVFRMFGAEQSS